MTIVANLADGRVLNFPDGTDPAVIQNTVKKMVGSAQTDTKPQPLEITAEGIGQQLAQQQIQPFERPFSVAAFKPIQAPEKFPPIKPRGGLREAFTGEQRQTESTRTLPEFRETKEIQEFAPRGIGNQIKLTAGLLSSFTPEGQMNVIKESIPEAEFFQDEKGNIIIDIEGERSLLNAPGFSGQDAVRAITNILGFFPASKIAQISKGLIGKFGIGAVGAGITEKGRQEVSQLAGSKEEGGAGEIALAAGLGGVGEVIGPGIKALRAKRAASRAATTVPEVLEAAPEIAAAREAAEGVEAFTGVKVPILQAQQTLIPSQLKLQRLLPQLDATSQGTARKLMKQNEAVAEAVGEAVETITPREVIGAPERLRTAAQRAIDTKRAVRAEVSSPLFEEAKDQIIDVSDVVRLIDSEAAPFLGKSNIKTQLETIKSNILRPGKPGAPQQASIAELQKAKAVIDDILSSPGDKKVSGDSRRIVQNIKEELLTAMDGAGAATREEAQAIRGTVKSIMDDVQQGVEVPEEQITQLPPYAQARIRFTQASPEVAQLTEGIVGRISDLDNLQIENMANTIFNPRLRSSTILDAKKVIETADPGAWNDILKFKVLDNMTKIRPPQAGAIENTAGKIRSALFGNAAQKKVLIAGMSPEQAKNFRYLDDMLDRASQGRFEGSPTASFQEAIKNIKSVPLLLQKVFTLRATEIQKVGEEGLLNSRLKAVANSIFDDTWADEITAIRKMNPNSEAAATRLGRLLQVVSDKASTTAKTAPQVVREEL